MDYLLNKEYILFLSLLGIIIILFIVFYLYLSKKIKEEKYVVLKVSQEFEESLRKSTEEELKKIINDLKTRVDNFSNKIILKYEEELSEFIKKIEDEFIALSLLSKEEREKFLKESEEKSKKLENQINKEFLKFTEINSQVRNFAINAIKKGVETIEKNITMETKTILEATNDIVSKKIIEIEKNIEEYRNKKLEEIDKKIYQLIGRVAKITIGHSLDLTTQEKLVMESLEKAKKESFF